MARLARSLLRGPSAADYRAKGIVTLRGPFFEKNITKVIEKQIIRNAFLSFEKRLRRVPKRKKKTMGRRRNPIPAGTLHLGGDLSIEFHSTKKWPRTTGSSWTAKEVAAIKKMAPNTLRVRAKEAVAALGGGGI